MKFIVNLVFLLNITVVFSQDVIHKDPQGVVRYIMKINDKTVNSELHFDQNKSLFIYNKIGMDSVQNAGGMETKENNGKVSEIELNFASIDEKGFLVYRDFLEEQLILRFPKLFPIEKHLVKEDWTDLNWVLVNEFKILNGYKAQQATLNFRGRKYIAWFTSEIPLPYGPWKFFGLPGLILNIQDSEGIVEFTFESINFSALENEISIPKEDQILSLKEHVYIYDYYNEMVANKMNEITKKVNSKSSFVLGDKTTKKTIEEIRKEKKIEIIYEWEEFPGDTPKPDFISNTEYLKENNSLILD